jgi:tRNA modification GTPase
LGARLARPGEFTQRAFLNGKLDLAQAESVADLIDAATATAARAAARSLSGAFSKEIGALVEALIELRMFIEATLDFPEEDVDFLRAADVRTRIEAVAARIAAVLVRAKQGALLREGLSVVLVGRPNVGKSSLLNQLAGAELAIVTPIAGTTRDAVQSPVEIDGIPLTIIDTAGLRATDDPIETIGIERTWTAVAGADLALVLVDAEAGDDISEPDAAILGNCRRAATPCRAQQDRSRGISARWRPIMLAHAGSSRDEPHVYLSAKTGEGVALLKREILALADVHEDMEDTFLARQRHLDALRAAAGHLDSARPTSRARSRRWSSPPRTCARRTRRSRSITGEFTSDDLLGAIFSRFCIGK